MARSVHVRDALLVIIGAFSFITLLYFWTSFAPIPHRPIVPSGQPHHDSGFYEEWIPPDGHSIPASKPMNSSRAFGVVHGEKQPRTKVINHAPGWTMFDNIYMSAGTMFVVADAEQEMVEKDGWYNGYPLRRMMISTGKPAYATEESMKEREPSDKDLFFISREEAVSRWGDQVYEIEGHSWLFWEAPQFYSHFYHFVAESLFGFWAFHAGTLDAHITARGETTAPLPSRAIFPFCKPENIRDSSKFNMLYMKAAFPATTLETSSDWEDRIHFTRDGTRAWRFAHATLGDRSASFRGRICGLQNQRIAAEARQVTEARTTRWWWEPIRRAVLRHARVSEEIIDIVINSNARFDDAPTTGGIGGEMRSIPKKETPIVITYISRQGGRRSLLEDDHIRLVTELTRLCEKRGWEFNHVKAQLLTQEEQLALAAKTTVLVGVHGNGLTHLLSMAPTMLSTVVEIFGKPGFAHDYEWTARTLGMKHYGIWNDTTLEHPHYPEAKTPEKEFQSSSIPVQGDLVARTIEIRVDSVLSLLQQSD